MPVIVCELRQKNCGGDIADKLTAESGKNESVHIEKIREKSSDSFNSRHVAREDEEEYKGQEKSVIHLQKRLSIEDEQREDDDNGSNPKRNYSEHNKYRKSE